jgi:hypothetical protein
MQIAFDFQGFEWEFDNIAKHLRLESFKASVIDLLGSSFTRIHREIPYQKYHIINI